MPFTDDGTAGFRHDAHERRLLLTLAAASIRHGLAHGTALRPNPADYPERLRQPGASFVTLEIQGALRGCIGTLEAYQPLYLDVAEHAYAAAFADPRFPPLGALEFPALDLHLSILGRPEPLRFGSESELLALIRPGLDGLILEDRGRRGTFLPSVWESLPDPASFLSQLKRKAGLPSDYWSETLRVQRYTTESFGERVERLV